MIYRKWSLLTGPAIILGGIVATVVVADYVFVEGPFFKSESKKQETSPASK